MDGRGLLETVPSGVSISMKVDGADKTPRFCAGSEKLRTSPGSALYPMEAPSVDVSPLRVRSTMTELACATKSTPTTLKSCTMVVAPTTSPTGSYTTTPLLV